ncbi:Transposase [Nostoc flagelliforme CCNUN1]|uniref:Transposase n=1 Tax=Nostoc flagelliforme CCNUN1 TaxID=2038116 RepID=A0A2K8T1S9_9NOSO|nr:Transposase [Nostoc flagelliforme CCNUN1]
MATIIEDYCSAVRSSITNDGHPPLEASGLKLQQNLILIEESLQRMEKSALPPPLVNLYLAPLRINY